MGHMVGTPISKGAMNAKWDHLHSTQKGRVWALKELVASRGKPIGKTLVKLKLLTAEQAEHLEAHWLGDKPPAWWPDKRPKGNLLREGYIKALEIAVKRKVPTYSVWVCTGGMFSVMIAPSEHQVTILVATPPVPNDVIPPVAVKLQDLFVVCSDNDAEALLMPYVENWMRAPNPKTMKKPIKKKSGAKDVVVVQPVWP